MINGRKAGHGTQRKDRRLKTKQTGFGAFAGMTDGVRELQGLAVKDYIL